MSYKFIQTLLGPPKQQPAPSNANNAKPSEPVSKPPTSVNPSHNGSKPIVQNDKRTDGFNIQKDDVDKINISTSEFYFKLDPTSSKTMAMSCLNNVIGNPEIIRKKICKRRFMFGKNIEHKTTKPGSNKPTTPKKQVKKDDLREFKKLPYDYSKLKSLNDNWNKYIIDLILAENKTEDALQRILKADFHGAHMTILDSKCNTLIGKAGIVIKETRNSFILCQSNNKPISVVKKTAVFQISIREKKYKIYGPALENRIEERFKAKLHFDHMYRMSKDLIKII